ncbi:MAG: hypothetical protein R3F38_19315 [Gammaproteobacteria bacterium]
MHDEYNCTYLSIEQVSMEFPTPNGVFKALDNVTLKIAKGELCR